jgi:precorrin-3B synthase
MNKVEEWKRAKHGFDVWPDLLRYAHERQPMKAIDDADLERMKWHGVFYRKRDGDGTYMLRLRVTAGELTSDQAKAIAYVAYQYGYGIVDITTRANIQVQGLAIENVPTALARLEATGMITKQTGHDNVRNVFGHPLSGVDPDELLDTRTLCQEITGFFLGSRVYSDLPRKFNIALNGRTEHALYYWSQDISFLAYRDQDCDVAFQMLLGGNQGQNPHLGRAVPVLVRPDQVVEFVRAILDLFRERGSREKRDAARFCYLLDAIGIGGVLDWLDEKLPFRLEPCPAEPPPPTGYEDLVGWFRQKQPQRWAMGLCVPLGRLAWQQLESMALLAKKWGDGTLRLTPEQGLIVPNIPTGFRDAAATAAAGCGLSPHADSLARSTMACTGKQFCNIAVTETKGLMFQLIEKLRQRALALHGIRIHMSGCPSSCAAHHTADIGLKGVRVRRLLGTREGFDVYLGGGVAGQVHLARPYRLGVDVQQLPRLIEEVVSEYYRAGRPGQTFSAYWREKLLGQDETKVGEADYHAPTWLCEGCGYEHQGEDPPVFCPSCAGLRRQFARVEADEAPAAATNGDNAAMPDSDGFWPVARIEDVPETEGLAVTAGGIELALFRSGGQILAVDNSCPHQGAPLAQGTLAGGVLTCPWHGWTFDVCKGCSLAPAGHSLRSYAVRLESGRVWVKLQAPRSVDEAAARGVLAGCTS